jgi:hypothetical protein
LIMASVALTISDNNQNNFAVDFKPDFIGDVTTTTAENIV